MAFKELLDQSKTHPKTVAVALFASLIVGCIGIVFYLKIAEQRTGLLDDRVVQIEQDTKQQKRINKVILGQISALRLGYKNLPVSLKQIKGEFENVVSLHILDAAKEKQVQDLIQILATDMKNVEIALEKSEVLLSTFDEFLNASLAEQEGRYAAARNLYTKAARLGNPDAQYRLGTLYVRGLGGEQNIVSASSWYVKAALAGNVGARAELAQLYSTGLGVKEDRVKALALYKLIENDAPLSAKARISEISSGLSRKQLKEALELAKKYSEAAK